MIEQITIYNGLLGVAMAQLSGPSSLWVHVTEGVETIDRHAVEKIIKQGCVNVFISGHSADQAEILFDEVIEDHAESLVLTSACHGTLEQCADQYQSVHEVAGRCIVHWMAVVISDKPSSVLEFYESVQESFDDVVVDRVL